jgi:hypothetical protein
MAIDWREVCVKALLADGKVDEPEIKVLRSCLKSTAGGLLQEGATFLTELRNAYTAKVKKGKLSPAFEKYYFSTITNYVLKDGEISEHEAAWLKDTLFKDKKIDDTEWKFLQNLNKKAKAKHSSFVTLYTEAEKSRGSKKKK